MKQVKRGVHRRGIHDHRGPSMLRRCTLIRRPRPTSYNIIQVPVAIGADKAWGGRLLASTLVLSKLRSEVGA